MTAAEVHIQATCDLSSLVLLLRARQSARLPHGHGHLVHAWFLRLLRRSDPTLARTLHAGSEKPFTLSLLQGPTQPSKNGQWLLIKEGETYWLRITLLDDLMGAEVTSRCLDYSEPVRLGSALFDLAGLVTESTTNPLAAQRDHDELLLAWLREPQPPFRLELHFASPTTFRSGNVYLPLPLPEHLFRRLAERWNLFAESHLPEEAIAELCAKARVARYELTTQRLNFNRYWAVGFVGSCTFDLGDGLAPEVRRLAHLLGDFAFFAGVGYKTTMGMGQAWPLSR